MSKKGSLATNIVSIVIIVLLSLILICNVWIIIQGAITPEEPPSLFGITPLVVLSGSMEGEADGCFSEGSMVFVTDVDPTDLNTGDVIAFHDPALKDGAITTHRIIEIKDVGDTRYIRTAGDFTGKPDSPEGVYPITDKDVVGIYSFHISGLGYFSDFLQSPIGMLIFIGLPILAFVVYVVLSKHRQTAGKDKKTAELEAELARLREQLAGGESTAQAEQQTAPSPETDVPREENADTSPASDAD